MKNTVLARRYAKALFLVAKESDAVAAYRKELEEIAAAYAAEPALRDGLNNPMYPVDVRAKVMEYLADGLGVDAVMRRFLLLLVDKKRSAVLPDIAESFAAMDDADRKVCKGTVTTAVQLDDELAERVRLALEKLTGKTVILESKTDPSILGGIVAKVGDLVLDGSLKTQLHELKESITGRD